MSTTLLYQAFGVRGYSYVRTEHRDGTTHVFMVKPRDRCRCSVCGSRDVVLRGGAERPFRLVPIGRRPTWVHVYLPRVSCRECEELRQVKIGFADPRVTYSRAFERYALDLSRATTIQDAAQHLGVSWDVVKGIQKRYLHQKFGRPKLKRLTQLAIDEISIGKGHRYVTVVLDLDSGAVVFVGDGKGAEALDPFWRRLRAAHARIQAVATDMSPAYIEAVRSHLPKAIHVFDHFHVVKLFNDKLADFRRELHREATDQLHKEVLKGTRWLLLKNPENLDPKRNERDRLDEALRMNQPLATAYYLKEDLRQIWLQPDKATARRVFDDWVRRAEASCIKMLQKFAVTLGKHKAGVLAYYDYRISTGPLEGTNNKIKTLTKKAYGFRDQEFFKLKIMGLHETKYALVG